VYMGDVALVVFAFLLLFFSFLFSSFLGVLAIPSFLFSSWWWCQLMDGMDGWGKGAWTID